MEELVVLLLFGLIVFFNFVIKKLAEKSTRQREAGTDAETSAEKQTEYSAPRRDIKDFLDEVRRKADEAYSGYPRTRPVESGPRPAQPGHIKGAGRPDPRVRRAKPAARSEKDVREKKQKTAGSAAKDRGESLTQKRTEAGRKRVAEGEKPISSGFTGKSRSELRKAIVMSEVLGRPLGLRDL